MTLIRSSYATGGTGSPVEPPSPWVTGRRTVTLNCREDDHSGQMRSGPPPLEFEVPAGADPHRCPDCGRPFATAEYLTFHRGDVHPDACRESELDAYETAREEEAFDLFTFHVTVAVVVLLTYFMFFFLYGLVWT